MPINEKTNHANCFMLRHLQHGSSFTPCWSPTIKEALAAHGGGDTSGISTEPSASAPGLKKVANLRANWNYALDKIIKPW